MEENQVVVWLIILKALLTAALIGLYCAGSWEKMQFMPLMICRENRVSSRKGEQKIILEVQAVSLKLNSAGLLQVLKQDQHMLMSFLLLSAAFTMPGLLRNAFKFISYITSKAGISIVDKA